MKLKLPDIAIIFLTLLLLVHLHLPALAATKVTICHATNSTTNPYIKETVNISSLGNGHGNNGVNPGDIIPPTPGTDFPNGNNWTTEGQAIYNNNCKIPKPTPTPSPTIGTNPTETPTPTSTPTSTTGLKPTAAPTTANTPTPTLGESPTATPTSTKGPKPTATPTPSIEVPTPTLTPIVLGNTCSIINQLNNTSSTGGNTINSNTGGSTSIVTGSASTNATVNSQCGVNVATLTINCPQNTQINVLDNGKGSTNQVLLTNNTVITISQ